MLDRSRDEFCQSLYENPGPKSVLLVSKAIKHVINQEILYISHFVVTMHVFSMNETLLMLYNSWLKILDSDDFMIS